MATIPENNLPIYFQQFTVSFLPPETGTLSWSLLSANPSNREYYRVWSFQLNGILAYTTRDTYIIEYNLDNVQTDGYVISFEGDCIGTITISNVLFVINNKTLKFTYEDDEDTSRKRITLELDARLCLVKPNQQKQFLLNFYLNDATRSQNIMLPWPIFQYIGLPNEYSSPTPIPENAIRFAIPSTVKFDEQGKSLTLLQLQATLNSIEKQVSTFSQMKSPSDLQQLLTQNISFIPTTEKSKTCTYIQGFGQPIPECASPKSLLLDFAYENAATANILLSNNSQNSVLFVVSESSAESYLARFDWLVQNPSQFDVATSYQLLPLYIPVFTDETYKQINVAQNTLTNRAQPFFNASGNYAKDGLGSLCSYQLNASIIGVGVSTLDPPIESVDTQPNTTSSNPYNNKTEYVGQNSNSKNEIVYLIPKYQVGICYDIQRSTKFFKYRITPDISGLSERNWSIYSVDDNDNNSYASRGTSQSVMVAAQFGGRLQQLINKKVPLNKVLYYYAYVFKYKGFKFLTEKVVKPDTNNSPCVFSTGINVNQYQNQVWNPFSGLGSFTNFETFWTPALQTFNETNGLLSYSTKTLSNVDAHYVLSSTIVLEGLNYLSFLPTDINQTCISKKFETINLPSTVTRPVLAPLNVFSCLVLSLVDDSSRTIQKGDTVVVWCPVLQLALAVDDSKTIFLKTKDLDDTRQQWKINVFYKNDSTTNMTLFDFLTFESVSVPNSFLILNSDGTCGLTQLSQPENSGIKWCIEPWAPIDIPQNDPTVATNVSPSYMVSILNVNSKTILTTDSSDRAVMIPLPTDATTSPPSPEWLLIPVLTTDFTLKVNYDDRYYCVYNTKQYKFLCLDKDTLTFTVKRITPDNSFDPISQDISSCITFNLQTISNRYPIIPDQPNDLFQNTYINKGNEIAFVTIQAPDNGLFPNNYVSSNSCGDNNTPCMQSTSYEWIFSSPPSTTETTTVTLQAPPNASFARQYMSTTCGGQKPCMQYQFPTKWNIRPKNPGQDNTRYYIQEQTTGQYLTTSVPDKFTAPGLKAINPPGVDEEWVLNVVRTTNLLRGLVTTPNPFQKSVAFYQSYLRRVSPSVGVIFASTSYMGVDGKNFLISSGQNDGGLSTSSLFTIWWMHPDLLVPLQNNVCIASPSYDVVLSTANSIPQPPLGVAAKPLDLQSTYFSTKDNASTLNASFSCIFGLTPLGTPLYTNIQSFNLLVSGINQDFENTLLAVFGPSNEISFDERNPEEETNSFELWKIRSPTIPGNFYTFYNTPQYTIETQTLAPGQQNKKITLVGGQTSVVTQTGNKIVFVPLFEL